MNPEMKARQLDSINITEVFFSFIQWLTQKKHKGAKKRISYIKMTWNFYQVNLRKHFLGIPKSIKYSTVTELRVITQQAFIYSLESISFTSVGIGSLSEIQLLWHNSSWLSDRSARLCIAVTAASVPFCQSQHGRNRTQKNSRFAQSGNTSDIFTVLTYCKSITQMLACWMVSKTVTIILVNITII